MKLRERDFGGDDYFDRTAVTRLEVRGYLPIRKEVPKGRDRWMMDLYDLGNFGEIRFESCMNVIRRFLSDCFDLDADVHAIEVASELWTIPVRPFERNLV